MSIVLQYDPRVNATYAYHNESRWDKESKQSSCSRILIGKVDPETGKVNPTSGSRRKKPIDEALVIEEIDAYNRKIDEKNKLEAELIGSNGQEIHNMKEQYAELQKKFDNLENVMLSFADSLKLVFSK